MLFRNIIAGVLLNLLMAGAAFAQCGTQAPANRFCGNDTGSPALATWKTVPTGALTPIAGGTVLGNRGTGSAAPSALTNPVLGIPGTSTGEVGLAGATSGTAVLRAQAAAGSAVSLLPTTAGTLVGSASAPLAIGSATGTISITGLAGGVLAGAGPAFTMTPALGATGVATGSIAFNGFTSGSVVVTPQSTAGTPVLTLPNTSGTFAVGATSPLVLSATTGGLTCPTCVTSSGGGAITGTAPIAVSAAGVVSINAPYTTLTASNGGIVYSDSTNLAILAGTATARQMLQSGASAAPAWSTAVWPATTTNQQLLYSASTNNVTGLTVVTGSVVAADGAGTLSMTRTPIIGVAGAAAGTLGFQNATSGTITVSPPAGALGSVTNTLQAAADTFVYRATTDTLTNKTYNAQGTGNVFQLDGVTVTGKAANSDYLAGTSTAKLIAPSVIYQAETTTTFGATTTFDFQTFINTAVTLTGNITTMTLSGVTAGKAGTITFIQDGTGSRTAAFSTTFKFARGTIPTLTTTANAIDVLTYSCRSATFCAASLMNDVKNP